MLAVLIWTLSTAAFVLIPGLSDTYIRTILGIPMVLFIPGYVLIAALFTKKSDLETVERIALSFGLSIAVIPLLGLILNFTFGIRLIPILATICIYTISLIFVAEYRRRKLSEDERFDVKFHKIYDIINNEINIPKSKLDKILTVILIFTAVMAVGMVYFVITTPKIGEKFTEFYVLDSAGKADNYQTSLTLGNNTTYMVGISNHEYSMVNYTLQVALNKSILTSKNTMLSHNQTWEENISIVPNKEGTDMKLEFWLFKENNFTEPYRKLHLWVNST